MIYCILGEQDTSQVGDKNKIKYVKKACGDHTNNGDLWRRTRRIYAMTEEGIKLVFRSWCWRRVALASGAIDFDLIPATESTPEGFIFITYYGIYTVFNGTVTQIGTFQYNDTYCRVYFSNGHFYAVKNYKTYMYSGSSWVEQKVNTYSVPSIKFGGSIVACKRIYSGSSYKVTVYTHDGTSFSSYRNTQIISDYYDGRLFAADDKLLWSPASSGSAPVYDVTSSPGVFIASDGPGFNYIVPDEFLYLSGNLYMTGIKVVYTVGSYSGLFKYNSSTLDWDIVFSESLTEEKHRIQKCGSGAVFLTYGTNKCHYINPETDESTPLDMFVGCSSIHNFDGIVYASGISMKGASSGSIYRLEEADTLQE